MSKTGRGVGGHYDSDRRRVTGSEFLKLLRSNLKSPLGYLKRTVGKVKSKGTGLTHSHFNASKLYTPGLARTPFKFGLNSFR